MNTGEGRLVEIYFDAGGRITCSQEMVPSPGQYLLAHADDSDYPLATPLFLSESATGGFRAAPPLASAWTPGTRLNLRGPLGHGFALPESARRVALIAFDASPARLRGLIPSALKQDSAITLACDSVSDDLPEEIEVQPVTAMRDLLRWADYVAVDVSRENLPLACEILRKPGKTKTPAEMQVLINTPMPCGTYAECGVCAVTLKDGWTMICKDGPVFDFEELK